MVIAEPIMCMPGVTLKCLQYCYTVECVLQGGFCQCHIILSVSMSYSVELADRSNSTSARVLGAGRFTSFADTESAQSAVSDLKQVSCRIGVMHS